MANPGDRKVETVYPTIWHTDGTVCEVDYAKPREQEFMLHGCGEWTPDEGRFCVMCAWPRDDLSYHDEDRFAYEERVRESN